MKHVYILGAGFSRPLGGPLFTQLLTDEFKPLINNLGFDDDMREALNSLHCQAAGKHRSLDSSIGRQHSPLNAEELIALLDWCERNTTSYKADALLTTIAPTRLQIAGIKDPADYFRRLNRQLKRLVAAQCNRFIAELEVESDVTAPYVSWLSQLTPDDTIVTFNYDSAIQELGKQCGKDFLLDAGAYRLDGLPRIYHMHGSVHWHMDGSKVETTPCAFEKDVDLCIGMPGLAKARITQIETMKTIWLGARNAINEAEVISIVGYSMPPSDNKARQELLGAMRNGQRVNLIVGSDSFTAGRLQSLMQPIVGVGPGAVSNVVDMKMYAQDYLPNVSIYARYGYTIKSPR